MNRRGFLGTMLAAVAAPAIVKAENLMKLRFVQSDYLLVPNAEQLLHLGGDFTVESWIKPTLAEWHHIAQVRCGADVVSYLNGKKVPTRDLEVLMNGKPLYTVETTPNPRSIYLGVVHGETMLYDDLRITKQANLHLISATD